MELNITISGLKPKNSEKDFDIAATDELHDSISEKLAEAIGNVLNTARDADINFAHLEWDQGVFHITIKSKSDRDGRRHRTEHQVEVIKPQ